MTICPPATPARIGPGLFVAVYRPNRYFALLAGAAVRYRPTATDPGPPPASILRDDMTEPQTIDGPSPTPPGAAGSPERNHSGAGVSNGLSDGSPKDLLEANRRFYDGLWSAARLIGPQRFNTWPLVEQLVARSSRRLEVAPGLRPRLPITGTHFVDISAPALARLRERGGRTALGSVTALPLPTEAFDLVCALDVVEHVEDDSAAWAEVSRVAAGGATLLLSVPLHPARWTGFDDFVGHKRRYAPQRLRAKLGGHGLTVEQSAVYGMQPRSSALLNLAVWFMTHRRREAMFWYNRVIMPIGLHFEKKLALSPGLIDLEGVDEVLLVCRKANSVGG